MKYSDFLLYILPGVSGCPDFTAERAIRDACIEFCIKTDLWIAEPDQLQVVPNVTEYDLSAPSGAEPNHILSLSRVGVSLEPMRYRDAFMMNASTTSSAPTYYGQRDNTSLLIGPKPTASERLDLLISLKPSSTSSSLPDTIGQENRETIAAGALYRLQMLPGQPWSNGGAAGTNKSIFDRGIVSAMRQSHYGFSGANLTVKPREFI